MNRTLASLTAAFALCATAFSAETPQPPEPMDHSYVKLFTLVGAPDLSKADDETIEYIAKNYAWINGHGGGWLKTAEEAGRTGEQSAYFAGPSGGRDDKGRTVGERLRAINPDIILTNYRNGTPTSQHALDEAREVESGLPLAICVHPTSATLLKEISDGDTVLMLKAPPKRDMQAGRRSFGRPAATQSSRPAIVNPPTYPFKASTTDGEFTVDKDHYVGWIRMQDEIMRIDEVSAENGQIQLTVRRGYFGTTATAHEAGDMVYQPIYCGSRRGEQMAEGLSGFPDAMAPQQSIRYLMMVQKPEMWEWLAGKSKEAFDEGYNGPWYDCTCSMWINHSNAFGDRVTPYDYDKKAPQTNEDFREAHQNKLDYMFKTFPGKDFYVNWIFPQYYWDNGEDRRLFTGEEGHHPISGGAVEMYGSRSHEWKSLFPMHRDMIDNKFRVVFWQKGGSTRQFILFAYGSYLLMQEPAAPHCFGGHWTMNASGQGPSENEGKYGAFTYPDFLNWDLGKPVDTWQKIEEAEIPGTPGAYQRRYEKGLVVVNPAYNEEKIVKLDQKLYEPEAKQWMEEVTLQPRQAALLLKWK